MLVPRATRTHRSVVDWGSLPCTQHPDRTVFCKPRQEEPGGTSNTSHPLPDITSPQATRYHWKQDGLERGKSREWLKGKLLSGNRGPALCPRLLTPKQQPLSLYRQREGSSHPTAMFASKHLNAVLSSFLF